MGELCLLQRAYVAGATLMLCVVAHGMDRAEPLAPGSVVVRDCEPAALMCDRDDGRVFTVSRVDGSDDLVVDFAGLVPERRGLVRRAYDLLSAPVRGAWRVATGIAQLLRDNGGSEIQEYDVDQARDHLLWLAMSDLQSS